MRLARELTNRTVSLRCAEFPQETVIRFIQEMLPFNPCRPELRSNTGRARDIGKEESKCVSSHLFVCFYSLSRPAIFGPGILTSGGACAR